VTEVSWYYIAIFCESTWV